MKKKLFGVFAAISVLGVFVCLALPFRAIAEVGNCTYEVGYMEITCLGSTSWCVIPYPENPIVCVGDHAIIKETDIQE